MGQKDMPCTHDQQVVLYAVGRYLSDRSVWSGGKQADHTDLPTALKSRHSWFTFDQLAVIPFSWSCLMNVCFVVVWSGSCTG